MSIVVGILVALHLIGWAVALGALVSRTKEPVVLPGVLHGLYLAVLAGLALTGIAGAQGTDLDYVKIAVKLVVALAVVALAIVGKNRPEKVTAGYLGGIAGLIVVNVFIAVLWK